MWVTAKTHTHADTLCAVSFLKIGDAFIRTPLPHTKSLIIIDRFPMQSPRGHASLIIQTGQRSQTLIMCWGVKGQPVGSQRSRQKQGTGRFRQQILLLTNQTWLVSAIRELITGCDQPCKAWWVIQSMADGASTEKMKLWRVGEIAMKREASFFLWC